MRDPLPEAVRQSVERIERLLDGHTDRNDEAAILGILGAATGPELRALIGALDLVRLIGDVDDHRLGPKNRSALLHMLCHERIDELDATARARLVSALQTGRTDALDEDSIVAVLLATTGDMLTHLKNLIDRGDDHRDLAQLVYSDVDDPARRRSLLDHFARQGASVATRSIKVLSDIDDTLYCNWVDVRYPKKTVYPGVRQLYEELGGDVTFVTARPRDRPGLIEKITHRTLREHGVEDPTVLAGSFANLLGNEAIAEKKLQNFVDYCDVFPEYDFVFIGDSGQGDAMFGQRMVVERPERVRAVHIPDVVSTSAPQRAKWAEVGVLLFDTYVGAAALCLERNLIGERGAQRVVDRAFEELDAITLDPERAAERRADLERDRQLVANVRRLAR